ncbi:unnamed protein product [Chrysoparadoxa australica]
MDRMKKGWKVYGTCTDPRKLKTLEERGIKAFLFDDWSGPMLQPEPLNALCSASHILSSVPPSVVTGEDPVLLAHAKEIEHVSKGRGGVASKLKWVGYLSSTGVYGDRGGGWVCEKDKPQPYHPRTKARYLAEQSWLKMKQAGTPVEVFRIAGIYGPGRSALDTVARYNGDIRLAGADDETFVSRIHVADIVRVLEASMMRPETGRVINVADSLPSTRYEVLAYAAKLLGHPRQDPDVGPEGRIPGGKRGGGNKRVDNTLMMDMLREAGSSLLYEDYRAGLSALHAGDKRPFEGPPVSAFGGEGAGARVEPGRHDAMRVLSAKVDSLVEVTNDIKAAVAELARAQARSGATGKADAGWALKDENDTGSVTDCATSDKEFSDGESTSGMSESVEPTEEPLPAVPAELEEAQHSRDDKQ